MTTITSLSLTITLIGIIEVGAQQWLLTHAIAGL